MKYGWLIFSTGILLLGLLGVILGIKKGDGILLGEGLFLLWGLSFGEMIRIKQELNDITDKTANGK